MYYLMICLWITVFILFCMVCFLRSHVRFLRCEAKRLGEKLHDQAMNATDLEIDIRSLKGWREQILLEIRSLKAVFDFKNKQDNR